MSAATPLALPHPPPIQPDWALFLDVDGCLLDFADRPEHVIVPAGLREDLARLRHALDGALALVSGRSLEQLDHLFPGMELVAAGLHGLQVREACGSLHLPGEAPIELGRVREAAEQVVRDHPGARVEDKGVALALHWRTAPHARSALEAIAHSSVGHLPGYRLQHGNCVVELRPGGQHKGSAIERLMQRAPFSGRLPVYAGDDFTDEDGFAMMNSLGGLSVIVGERRPTQARHGIEHTEALRRWLADAAHRLGPAA